MQYFYWYLYVLLWVFVFIAPNIGLKAQQRLMAFYCGIWAFVFGFRRYDVGNDTPGYAAYFENVGTGYGYGTVDRPFETIEEGFWFLSKVVNFFTESATVVFLIIGIALWSLIYQLYKANSKTPLLSLLFMMTITGRMFYTLEIAVRQTVSIIVILAGILCFQKSGIQSWKNILKSKWAIAGLILCLSSVTVHRTTGILMVFMAFIHFIKINKSIPYLLILGFALFAIFGAATFGQIFDMTMLFIGGFSDENVNLLGDRYIGDVNGKSGFSTGTMLAWVFPTLLTVYLTKKEKINTYFFKTFIFTYCLHQLMQFSTMHERLITLFILMGFTMSIPEICSRKRNIYYAYLLIGGYYVFLSYKMFYNWPLQDDAAVPYYFIWQ